MCLCGSKDSSEEPELTMTILKFRIFDFSVDPRIRTWLFGFQVDSRDSSVNLRNPV